MDDQQTIRLECLSLAIKGGSPAHEWRRTAEVLAAWVIGEPIHHPATIHLHDSALDTLADAMRRHTTAEEIDPNPYITVTRPDGYLINKDLGGWYFLAPGEVRRPFGRAVWATEDEAVADSIRHALCPAWAPEDPQMGELAHPPGKTPALDALLNKLPTLAEAVEMLLPRLKQNRAGEWYLAGEMAQTDHIGAALFQAAGR